MRTLTTVLGTAAVVLVASFLLPQIGPITGAAAPSTGLPGTAAPAVAASAGLAAAPASIAAALPFTITAAANGVPAQVNHQGVVTVNGTRFTGSGAFRFALLDPDTNTNVWTNDGSNVGGAGSPSTAVSLAVSDGLYGIRLGDTSLPNMVALGASLFSDDNLRLRVWFDDGINGPQQLNPDHALSSSPYAFMAATVTDGAISTAKIADGAVNLAKIGSTASDPSPIQTYAQNDPHVVVPENGTAYLEPGLTVTVPPGKYHNFIVTYSANLIYNYGERTPGQTSFHLAWWATPQINGVDAAPSSIVATSGVRYDWNQFGGNSYYQMPLSTHWAIRLGEGTHTLRVKFTGNSNGTMQQARFNLHRVQIMRVN